MRYIRSATECIAQNKTLASNFPVGQMMSDYDRLREIVRHCAQHTPKLAAQPTAVSTASKRTAAEHRTYSQEGHKALSLEQSQRRPISSSFTPVQQLPCSADATAGCKTKSDRAQPIRICWSLRAPHCRTFARISALLAECAPGRRSSRGHCWEGWAVSARERSARSYTKGSRVSLWMRVD